MQLLNIFHTGGLTLGLTLVWLFLVIKFMSQSIKGHKTEYGYYNIHGEWIKLADKTPYFKIVYTWFAIAVTVLYIVAMFFVASDYKGV